MVKKAKPTENKQLFLDPSDDQASRANRHLQTLRRQVQIENPSLSGAEAPCVELAGAFKPQLKNYHSVSVD